MPFIDSILNHRSLAIVGMDKNTGKTETLNYILRRIPQSVKLAVTSIGTDGELRDLVSGTPKPEISLREETLFGTAERYYAGRKLTSEVLDISSSSTAAGRIVTARVLTPGKVMLSGPSSTKELERWVVNAGDFGAQLTITDGALSRRSLASPAICDAMVLATGAAFSTDTKKIVRETAHAVELMKLPQTHGMLKAKAGKLKGGIWGIYSDGSAKTLGMATTFSGGLPEAAALEGMEAVYIGGALTDRLLSALRPHKPVPEIIVEDFTKIFVSASSLGIWKLAGGKISVLRSSRLIAITVNPVSPGGAKLDSQSLVRELTHATGIPAYDVRNCYDIR